LVKVDYYPSRGNYVNILGAALQEYDTGIPVPDGQTPEQIYTDLAWDVLFKAFFT